MVTVVATKTGEVLKVVEVLVEATMIPVVVRRSWWWRKEFHAVNSKTGL